MKYLNKTLAKMIKYEPYQKIGTCTYIKDDEPVYYDGLMKRRAIFICPICEEEFVAQISNIKSGKIKSCCGNKDNYKGSIATNTKHGMKKHRIYRIWRGIKARCLNPNVSIYKYYGGRGITICEEWKEFMNFRDDMFPSYKDDLTIDRIDVDGNYEPGNCRWATVGEQNRNKRNTWYIEHDGERMCAKDFCKRIDLDYSTFQKRLKRGWTIEESVNPIMRMQNKYRSKLIENIISYE